MSNISIVLIFFKKSSVYINSNNNSVNAKKLLFVMIQYINCALVTFISSSITSTIIPISSYLWSTNKLSNVGHLLLFCMSIIFDININVIFLHLQFSYMKRYYILCCNPFRIELKDLVTNIYNIDIQTSETTTFTNNIKDITDNKYDASTTTNNTESIELRGCEPTTTSNMYNSERLQPDDDIKYSNSDDSNSQFLYICTCCPVTLQI